MVLKLYEHFLNERLSFFSALIRKKLKYKIGGSDTLFELINSQSSSLKISHWIYNTYITSGGNLILGLVKRRQKKQIYFLSQ